MRDCTTLLTSVRYYTKEVKSRNASENVTDRQERVLGFNQTVMDKLKVLQIGAGGLGGEIAQGLVRKGVGVLRIFDGDTVEVSNLSRQFFYEEDLHKNKAVCLGKNLVKEGIKRSHIIAYPFMFQRAIEEKIDIDCDIVICSPDNDDARVFTARYFYKKVPVIFTGLDRNASTGYVFIQRPKEACFVCAFPEAIKNKRESCTNASAIIDLVKIIAGFVLFAIDSVVMERKIDWNFRQIFVAGFAPEVLTNTERKKDCYICREK